MQVVIVGDEVDRAKLQSAIGTPAAGMKVFVRASQMVNGWESAPMTFVAIVPASA